tara:strand:+ start:253 stop:609 length:357 start_codon:yes stop_codon:yes gene_type:complete
MKPDVKRILTKLSKNKVELANISSFKKQVDKLEGEFKSALKRNININGDLLKNISDFEQVESKYIKLDSDVKDIKKAFKDLGVDIDSNTQTYIASVDIRQRAIKKIVSNSVKGQQSFK